MVLHMPASEIQDGVISGKIKIAVIGLGQVSLPQTFHFVKIGASVIGVDIDERKINLIKQGVCPSGTRELVEMFDLFGRSDNFEAAADTVSAVVWFSLVPQ